MKTPGGDRKPRRERRAAPELVDLAAQLRVAFALVARTQRQEISGKLTSVQLSALYKIETHGPIRLGALAACEQCAGPTMTRVVASLEDAGLVHRATDPESARCSLISITPAGRAELEAVRRDRNDHMLCRLSTLDAKHQAALAAALPALAALVEAVVPRDDPARREMDRTRAANEEVKAKKLGKVLTRPR